MSQKVDFIDTEGYRRRVLLPDSAALDNPEAGIPLSLDIADLVPQFSAKELSNYLFERGLVEPDDFLKPEASPIIMECLRRFYALDVAIIQSHAINVKKGK